MTTTQLSATGMRRARRSAGQALAEFALVAPIFFLLLFAIIEAGRFIYHYETLNNAARAGTRYAMIHGSNASCPSGPPAPSSTACDVPGDNVRQAVSDAAFGLVGVGGMTIDLVYGPPATNARGTNVNVSLTYTYAPLLPGFPSLTIQTESNSVINN